MLQRVLGAGSFMLVDSAEGRRRYINWTCGCKATEEGEDRFSVASCERHEPLISRHKSST
jgi:hypothetical protein